jgi:hypothetical protein
MEPTPFPPPDTESVPSYHSETVVELLFSCDKSRRAVISTDREGLYRIHTDFWSLADFDRTGEGLWEEDDRFATITDSRESARKLAKEALHELE